MPCCYRAVYPRVAVGVLLAVHAAVAAPPEGLNRQYGGLTLDQWQRQLGQLDPADPHSARVVPALIAIIQDDDLAADVRRPFAVTLGRIGLPARDAIPVLIAQIENRKRISKPTYVWAARALGLFGLHAKEAAPALIDAGHFT